MVRVRSSRSNLTQQLWSQVPASGPTETSKESELIGWPRRLNLEMSTRMGRLSLLAVSVLLIVVACSANSGAELPPEPPPMSVLDESGKVLAETPAGSWCRNGLITENCAAVDRPVPEVTVACETEIAVALPENFTPEPGPPLGSMEAGVWPVTTTDGGILVRADGSGDWSRASWSFDLIRESC